MYPWRAHGAAGDISANSMLAKLSTYLAPYRACLPLSLLSHRYPSVAAWAKRADMAPARRKPNPAPHGPLDPTRGHAPPGGGRIVGGQAGAGLCYLCLLMPFYRGAGGTMAPHSARRVYRRCAWHLYGAPAPHDMVSL